MITVKVISSEKQTYWYSDKIGCKFDVIEDYGLFYRLSDYRFIAKKDCIKVNKELEIPDDLFEL